MRVPKKYFSVGCRLLGTLVLVNIFILQVKLFSVKKDGELSTNITLFSEICKRNVSTRSRRSPVNVTTPNWSDLKRRFHWLESGGRFKPKNCSNPNRVAILIPYQNRETHLKILLQNLHPFLQRQHIQYGVFIIEPVLNMTFNKGQLMNIGYLEALLRMDYQCFIFHDVDLIPEDDANLYTCPRMPRHMSVAVNKFGYRLNHPDQFGGVTAMSKEHFKLVNGYSNLYYGWGNEDVDMNLRLRANGLTISRYPEEIARYTMIKHTRDKHNKVNILRWKLVYDFRRYPFDGLNSLRYYLLDTIEEKLYTKFVVHLDPADYNVKENRYPRPTETDIAIGMFTCLLVLLILIVVYRWLSAYSSISSAEP